MLNLFATRSIDLPRELAEQLQAEAKRHRTSVPELLAGWLEDCSDGRDAAKRSAALASGKAKAIPAAEVYAKISI